ncbi:MAG: 6-phosphofructokinase [Spirochaetia bacterium]|nr:6-phosphofructokinase [Spirochaetia bacterium]
MATQVKRIGILTSGGDSPGLNAAIRGVAKTVLREDVEVVGIQDGFSGLIENRTRVLHWDELTNILTLGGTILGTSRNKPHKYPIGKGEVADMSDKALENYHKLGLDCLVCLGGGGTQKNAFRLSQRGKINIVTLPKTIDNDIGGTDMSFGFDTAMTIACEAIDRLHTTASSHHRCMLVDIMGHRAGWLALTAGLAGGADVILIPEIPFRFSKVIKALMKREKMNKRFSIIAVAEGAEALDEELPGFDKKQKDGFHPSISQSLATYIEKELELETRVTTLGHLQRGGTPTPADRTLATLLGARAGECILAGEFGVMIAYRNGAAVPVPLEEIAGKKKLVQLDHPLVKTARLLGISLGD